jgi:hypothetical protein
MELQELCEGHYRFCEDTEPDEGHVLASPELHTHRQLELQELYEKIYDQIEPTCESMGVTPKTMSSAPETLLTTKNAFLMKTMTAATPLTNSDTTLMEATTATIFDNAFPVPGQ